MLLAGDVGGTKTMLAIYDPVAGADQPVAEGKFANAQFASFERIVQQFLAEHSVGIDRACVGVAGPVLGGQARVTNLPWLISEHRLQEVLGIERVALINDLQAIATAVPHLPPTDLHTLNAGDPQDRGAIAVIAPGTGLGEAYLTWNGQRYVAHACEGGHTEFGPTNMLELEMLRYYLQRMDHVSYERFCSGSGLPNIYYFLKDHGYAPEPAWLAEQLVEASDPTPVIVNAAMHSDAPPELCAMTLELFVSILAAEAGNLALKINSTAGVYLGGGIPPRIIPRLEHHRFLQAFVRKGRMSDLLIRMPVHVILNTQAGLLGAAYHGLAEL